MSEEPPVGVVFPEVDGRRSTSAFGRATVAASLRRVDPAGAAAAERETNWRRGYVEHFRRLVEAGLVSADAARTIAADGLAALTTGLRYRGPGTSEEVALGEAVTAGSPGTEPPRTVEVAGTAEAERELTVPYGGSRLAGDDLRRLLDDWVAAGVVEPSFAAAIGQVVAHPEWLDLRGWTVAVIGAAAEMGPYRSLTRWGATVAAVDLPREGIWRTVLAEARAGAGRVLVPAVPENGDSHAPDSDLARRAGVDVVHDLPRAARWVAELTGDLVVGNYVYADGGANVRVAAAVDAVSEYARAQRSDRTALAFLATPTDCFAVPVDAVAQSTAAYESTRSKYARGAIRALSVGRLLHRNYAPSSDPGLNDSIVVQQGPNYLLAKRLQRWRATTATAAGELVSCHVAPPTRTRSVVKNRALAAAYGGAHRFGVTVFEPGTANTLMAALLVHDLVAGVPRYPQPWQDEAYAAAHGGLWRAAYEPRSALGLAAVLGWGSAR